MSTNIGYVAAAAQIGLNAILVKPKRGIGTIIPQVVIEEIHNDRLEITDHPIAQGAVISDHAYKRPAELVIRCGWSNSPSISGLVDGLVGAVTGTVDGVQALVTGNTTQQVRDVYKALLALQEKREPFDVYTGKRVYSNMLIYGLTVTTDKQSENTLMVLANLRQLIMVSSQTINVNTTPKSSMADPGANAGVVSNGQVRLAPTQNLNTSKLGLFDLNLYRGP